MIPLKTQYIKATSIGYTNNSICIWLDEYKPFDENYFDTGYRQAKKVIIITILASILFFLCRSFIVKLLPIL